MTIAVARQAGVVVIPRRRILGWLVAIVVAGSAAAGPRAFGVLAIAVAAVIAVEACVAVGRVLAMPVVPVAVGVAAGLPAAVVAGTVDLADVASSFAAALVVGTFALLVLFGRRGGATAAAAATALIGLGVGLGAASAAALRATPDGLQWTAAVVMLVAVPEAAATAVAAAQLRLSLGWVRVTVAAGLCALIVAVSGGQPLTVGALGALAVVSLVTAEVARQLDPRLLPARSTKAVTVGDWVPTTGAGDVATTVAATLLAAPGALLLAQVVQP